MVSVQAHDDTQCGFAYSTADQVAYCPVMEPPIWPALLQLPEDQYIGDAPQAVNASGSALNISSAPLLYTGNDRATADALMSALFARQQFVGETVTTSNCCTRRQICAADWQFHSPLGLGLSAVSSDCFPGPHACSVSFHALPVHKNTFVQQLATMHYTHTHTIEV